MPLLSKKEQRAVYETWLAVRPQKGKWIRLVRIPIPNRSDMATYVSYNEDARFLALWQGMTLITTDGEPRVQFGSPILGEIQEKARSKGYRTIIVDAPTGLVFH